MTPRANMLNLAKRYVLARSREGKAPEPNGYTEGADACGGALLELLVRELRPALRAVGRSIPIGGEAHAVALTPEGYFVRVRAGGMDARIEASLLLREQLDLRTILNDLDVALVRSGRPDTAGGATLVREVRDVLEPRLAVTSPRPTSQRE